MNQNVTYFYMFNYTDNWFRENLAKDVTIRDDRYLLGRFFF